MLRATWTHGRRCALIGASAAVVCLGGVLAACGSGGDGDGYVAVGAPGGPPRASATAVAPTGEVTLVPLDGPGDDTRGGASGSPDGGGDTGALPDAGTSPPPGDAPADSSPEASESSRTTVSSPSPTPSPTPTPAPAPTPTAGPAQPAALRVSDPEREPTDQRWCEKVTLVFHNSGGTAVRSGTVTFGTHIIGALGVDWATIESTEKLPAPVEAGARKERTWTVCVDAWRVPLGMHIETRDVDVRWR
jgi:hypothetical protein